jgi:hypothetical protein
VGAGLRNGAGLPCHRRSVGHVHVRHLHVGDGKSAAKTHDQKNSQSKVASVASRPGCLAVSKRAQTQKRQAQETIAATAAVSDSPAKSVHRTFPTSSDLTFFHVGIAEIFPIAKRRVADARRDDDIVSQICQSHESRCVKHGGSANDRSPKWAGEPETREAQTRGYACADAR